MPGTVIKLEECHRRDWQDLYSQYSTFYQRELTDDVADTVWGWLNDSGHVLEGRLVVDGEGKTRGLMHFRAMPRPLHGKEVGFLDDLFVSPGARGQGLFELMLQHLGAIGTQRGWSVIRWLTADDNYRARAAYDRLASKTSWNLYEMPCRSG